MINKKSCKKITILARHKLIYIDSILPVLYSLSIKHDIYIKVIVLDYALGYKAIKENVIINDIINSMGEVILIQGRSKYKLVRWANSFKTLFGLALDGIKGGVLIHFGLANIFPFRFLRMFHSNKVYLSETGILYEKWREVESNFLNKSFADFSETNIYNDKVICYTREFSEYCHKNKWSSFFYGPSRITSSWIDFMTTNQKKYLELFHPRIKDSDVVVTFFITYLENLPMLDKNTTVYDLFIDILDVFEKYYPDIVLMIKPHPTTDIHRVEQELKNRSIKYQITYLHPTMLILRSSLIIGSYVTNVFGDSKLIGVPAIEYTKYSEDRLKFSSGSSFCKEYIDVFINKNIDELVDAVKQNILHKNLLNNPQSFEEEKLFKDIMKK